MTRTSSGPRTASLVMSLANHCCYSCVIPTRALMESGEPRMMTMEISACNSLRLRLMRATTRRVRLVGITTDLAGRLRFQDVPMVPDTGAGTSPIVDIGAYERVDEFAPTVVTVAINAGSAQRSIVKAVTVTFSEPVTLEDDALTVLRSDGAAVPNTIIDIASEDHRAYILTFRAAGRDRRIPGGWAVPGRGPCRWREGLGRERAHGRL